MIQVKLKQRIPSFILLCLSSLFLWMAFFPSQYSLLSNLMQIVNGNNPFSSEYLSLTLGALFTIFTILLLVAILLFDGTTFFFDKLYNYHTVHKLIFIFVVLESLTEILAFSFLSYTRKTEHDFFGAWNIVSLGVNLITSISYFVTEILWIHQPFAKIKKEITQEVKKEPVFQTVEKEKEDQKKATKKEMVSMVTKLLDEKKITKEEADKMIGRIYED